MERNKTDDPMTHILLEEPKTVITKWPAPKFVMRDENAGEKIRSIAEIVGFIGSLIALMAGIVIWFQTNSVVGFLIGLLIAVGGIFVSYFLVLLSYSYVNIITNTIEQTKILKRLETQNLTVVPQRSDEAAPEQPAAETVSKIKKADITTANPDEGEDADDDAPSATEPQAAENTKASAKWPLVGVVDSRMRRVAHFAERSKYGIICPICNRKQSSDMDNCYFCDCRFIFDNEQPKGKDSDLLDRLKHLSAK